jgi:hypothetical protein
MAVGAEQRTSEEAGGTDCILGHRPLDPFEIARLPRPNHELGSHEVHGRLIRPLDGGRAGIGGHARHLDHLQ